MQPLQTSVIRGSLISTLNGPMRAEDLSVGTVLTSFDKEWKLISSKITDVRSKFFSQFIELVSDHTTFYKELRIPLSQYIMTSTGAMKASDIVEGTMIYDGKNYVPVVSTEHVYLTAPFYVIQTDVHAPVIIERVVVFQN